MLIEVCAFSLESCLTAQQAGAGRIELCGGLADGGTTPSAGLIQQARQHLTIPFYVMIRPRGGDFMYTATELDVMKADILMAKTLGADGIVLGVLQADGTVNEAQTRELIELAKPLPVTFHRAFDMTRDPLEALEAVIRTGAVRILTSGQHQNVEAGLSTLRQLAELAAGRIEIMAGAGVNAQNAKPLIEAGVDALHLSGSVKEDSKMTYRQPSVSMASSLPDEYEYVEANEEKISKVVEQTTAQSLGSPK
ncbi:copper homeostasis protein CutC [Spirosoma validum]|uniref:PF03932 family protein CutC n=1 Tax=Spirosoma validum TaxID=2771355 RepID=A0A927B310_9BACT|nr:copper homeostasis protein CutC [Spirosoma validum]MBD2754654.1 copper homeostasis protein CutC [Spirosoma validum]